MKVRKLEKGITLEMVETKFPKLNEDELDVLGYIAKKPNNKLDIYSNYKICQIYKNKFDFTPYQKMDDYKEKNLEILTPQEIKMILENLHLSQIPTILIKILLNGTALTKEIIIELLTKTSGNKYRNSYLEILNTTVLDNIDRLLTPKEVNGILEILAIEQRNIILNIRKYFRKNNVNSLCKTPYEKEYNVISKLIYAIISVAIKDKKFRDNLKIDYKISEITKEKVKGQGKNHRIKINGRTLANIEHNINTIISMSLYKENFDTNLYPIYTNSFMIYKILMQPNHYDNQFKKLMEKEVNTFEEVDLIEFIRLTSMYRYRLKTKGLFPYKECDDYLTQCVIKILEILNALGFSINQQEELFKFPTRLFSDNSLYSLRTLLTIINDVNDNKVIENYYKLFMKNYEVSQFYVSGLVKSFTLEEIEKMIETIQSNKLNKTLKTQLLRYIRNCTYELFNDNSLEHNEKILTLLEKYIMFYLKEGNNDCGELDVIINLYFEGFSCYVIDPTDYYSNVGTFNKILLPHKEKMEEFLRTTSSIPIDKQEIAKKIKENYNQLMCRNLKLMKYWI